MIGWSGHSRSWAWLAGIALATCLATSAAGCGRPTNSSYTPGNFFGSGMSENGDKYSKQLLSRNANERNLAILNLSNLQDPYTVPALIEELDDEVEWNRYNAAGALVRITNQNFHVDEKAKWLAWWKAKGSEFIDNYDEIRKKTPGEEGVKILATEGLGYYAQGDFPNAIKKMREATQRTPSNWEYHNLLGQAYLAQGYLIDSRLEFQVALGIDPEVLEPRLNLARTYVENDVPDWETAQDILQRTMELETKILAARKEVDRKRNWQLPYVLGWVFLNRGDSTRDDFRQALKSFNDSLSIQEKAGTPPSPDTVNQMVIAAHRAGQEYEAWHRIQQLRLLNLDVQESLYNEVKKALEQQDPNIAVPPYRPDANPVTARQQEASLPRPPSVFKPTPR